MNYMKQKPIIEYHRSLLYCRVSSVKQVKDGDGINSQELRCAQRSDVLGLKIAEVFKDRAVSGSLADRPAMQALLKFLDDNPNEKFVVIFDDLKRFARDVQVHLFLKTELVIKRKVRLECLNFKFEDSPTGRFIEMVMAAAAQLDKEQNAEQVVNKTKARLEAGFFPFSQPPIGLKYKKDEFRGKVLVSNEPYSNIYKSAIEKYRDYELNTLEQAKLFIETKYRENNINKTISLNGVKRLLSCLLYAGYIEYKPWNVERRKAQHEGFITYDTYLQVQDRLEGKAKPRLRKDYNEDFPVRNFALCIECKLPLTAGWFGGNGGKYPRYLCKTFNCLRKNKTIHQDKLESSFENLLRSVNPNPKVLEFFKAILADVWQSRSKRQGIIKTTYLKDIANLEDQNNSLVGRIPKTNNESVINQYENNISKNLQEIEKIKKKMDKIKYTQADFQTALSVVLDYIAYPIKQWKNKDYRRKRLLLRMYFSDKLIWHPENGFQTVELPLILELSKHKTTSKNTVVEMAGVKPASKTNVSLHCSQD
jgi:site-specific DNA recombinase